jgi:uncharacterized protein (TIGR03083 family)
MAIDYRQIIIDETAAMVGTVGAHGTAVPVPSCPEWNLGELAVHMGQVQRWATAIVNAAEPPTTYNPPPDYDETPPAHYLAAGVGPLVEALDAADMSAPTWTFVGTPLTKAFWLRRQAIEVAIHRWDAENAAAGFATSLDPILAADSIDEHLRLMMPRIVRRTKADISGLVGDVHVHCTDTEGEWTFDVNDGGLRVTTGHGKATTAVRGPASDVALFLFNRVPAERVEIFGDHTLLTSWQYILRF